MFVDNCCCLVVIGCFSKAFQQLPPHLQAPQTTPSFPPLQRVSPMHTTTLNSLLCICVAFTLVSFSTGQNVYIVGNIVVVVVGVSVLKYHTASVSHSIINQTSLSPAAITNKSLNYYEVDIVSAKQAGKLR